MRMAVLEVKEVVVMMVLLVLLKLLVAVSDQDSCSPRQHGGCWERCWVALIPSNTLPPLYLNSNPAHLTWGASYIMLIQGWLANKISPKMDISFMFNWADIFRKHHFVAKMGITSHGAAIRAGTRHHFCSSFEHCSKKPSTPPLAPRFEHLVANFFDRLSHQRLFRRTLTK